ncbi:MAG: hypothetical protein AB7Q00_06860 [Phycisphaerales bacterium]|nr:MAG: hypothetical protein IPK69_11550 [Phycisphaerales bacterium]
MCPPMMESATNFASTAGDAVGHAGDAVTQAGSGLSEALGAISIHLPALTGSTLALQPAGVAGTNMSSDDVTKIVLIALGVSLMVILVVVKAVQRVSIARAREQSRREIAAYVAEGSITPDDAVKMMNAGGSAWEKFKGGCGV